MNNVSEELNPFPHDKERITDEDKLFLITLKATEVENAIAVAAILSNKNVVCYHVDKEGCLGISIYGTNSSDLNNLNNQLELLYPRAFMNYLPLDINITELKEGRWFILNA